MPIDITRSSILDDGTFLFPTRGPKTIPVEEETSGRNALRGLNLLQTRYDAPIYPQSLSTSLEYLYDHLPVEVRGLMTWLSPDDFDMFPNGIDRDDSEAYGTYLETIKDGLDSTYDSVRKHEYYIQQIDTKDGHYVTVILHLRKAEPDAGKSEAFTEVDYSVFVDPSEGPESEARVALARARVAAFLRPVLSNLSDRGDHEGALWVPASQYADEDWSSGLRAYVLFEQFTRRLVDLFCAGRTYDAETLWAPTCGFTNLEKARDDMIGAASRQVRRYLDWTPRVTLSMLKRPKGGKEDPQAAVQQRLQFDPRVSRMLQSPDDDDDESQDIVTSQSEVEEEEEEEAASVVVATYDGSGRSRSPSPQARTSLPSSSSSTRKGLPRIDESEDEDEEDLHVDEALIQLAGGDESAEEEMEVKPASKAASPVADTDGDAEMADAGDGEDAEGEAVAQDDATAADNGDSSRPVAASKYSEEEDTEHLAEVEPEYSPRFPEDDDIPVVSGPGDQPLALSEVTKQDDAITTDKGKDLALPIPDTRHSEAEDKQAGGDDDDDNDDTPAFHRTQGPEDLPGPMAVVTWNSVNRPGSSPPTPQSEFDGTKSETISMDGHGAVGQSYFEMEVESPAPATPQGAESDPDADGIEMDFPEYETPKALPDTEYRSSTPTEIEEELDLDICESTPPPTSPESVVAEDMVFVRSHSPSPQPEAPMGSLSPPLIPQSPPIDAPGTPVPGPSSRSTPPPPPSEGPKRKHGAEEDEGDFDNYDDDNDDDTKEHPAKRQHVETTTPTLDDRVEEYDPAAPSLGAPEPPQAADDDGADVHADADAAPVETNPTLSASSTAVVTATGYQIPGLTLTQEPASLDGETMLLPETQAAEAEEDGGEGKEQ